MNSPDTSILKSQDTERVLKLFERMHVIRQFEECAAAQWHAGKVRGSVHQSTGQEAVAVGVCANLRDTDYLFSNHRGHGHAIAKGADPIAMMKELFGRVGGTCGGKGGSMHIADFSVGMLGANGILADGATMGAGAAQAVQLRGEDRIVCVFIGDGTTNRGPFFEALNWAQVFKLPVLFIIEDNVYASTTLTHSVMAGPGIASRAAAFGIDAVSVDGNDLFAVDRAAARLVNEVRSERTPCMLHATTYRIKGHLAWDKLTYRRPGETEAHWAHEPIAPVRRWLIAQGVSASRCDQIASGAETLLQNAIAAAEAAPYPERGAAFSDVQDVGSPVCPPRPLERSLVPGASPASEPASTSGTRLSFADAMRHALAEEMRRDPTVWALGEDLSTAYGNSSAAQYLGLVDEFGRQRIVDTPISESTIMGAAVGAAVAGTRPVADLRMVDFGLCAIDELVNQAAKIRYMFGGQARVPLVARESIGLKGGNAAQHCQSYEAWFAHVPGLVVVAPATPADGRGLFKSAIRCDDPVVFLEHKDLWASEGNVDLTVDGAIPLGVARRVRRGKHLTIVAWSKMAVLAGEAGDQLAALGIEADILDLRTIWPWDKHAVFESVRQTGRLLVAQETVLAGGFANEIAAEVSEALHASLRAPVKRLGAPRVPVPFSLPLEREVRVEVADIVRDATALARM